MTQSPNHSISLPSSFNHKLFVPTDDGRLGFLDRVHARAERPLFQLPAEFVQQNFIADGVGFNISIREISNISSQSELVRHSLRKKAVTYPLHSSRNQILLGDFHQVRIAPTSAGRGGSGILDLMLFSVPLRLGGFSSAARRAEQPSRERYHGPQQFQDSPDRYSHDAEG